MATLNSLRNVRPAAQHVLAHYEDMVDFEHGQTLVEYINNQIEAVTADWNQYNLQRQVRALAEGGDFLVHTEDIEYFLESELDLNGKCKKYDSDKMFNTYVAALWHGVNYLLKNDGFIPYTTTPDQYQDIKMAMLKERSKVNFKKADIDMIITASLSHNWNRVYDSKFYKEFGSDYCSMLEVLTKLELI